MKSDNVNIRIQFSRLLFMIAIIVFASSNASAATCSFNQAGSVSFGTINPDVNNVVTATTLPTIFVCRGVGGGGRAYTVTYDKGVRNNNTLGDNGGTGPHFLAYSHSITSPLTGIAFQNVPISLDHSGSISNYEDTYCASPIAACAYADTITLTITY